MKIQPYCPNCHYILGHVAAYHDKAREVHDEHGVVAYTCPVCCHDVTQRRDMWEYRTGFLEDDVMTALGKEGWELCAAWSGVAFFKRRVYD